MWIDFIKKMKLYCIVVSRSVNSVLCVWQNYKLGLINFDQSAYLLVKSVQFYVFFIFCFHTFLFKVPLTKKRVETDIVNNQITL